MVRRAAVPGAQARWAGAREGAGWVVRVEEGEEVWGEGCVVGLLEAGEGEGAWDVLAGFGGCGRGWLVWVQGAAVVFWGSELVAG